MTTGRDNPINCTPLKLTSTPTLIECGAHRYRSRSVSWNASGNYLAAASSCGSVRLFTVDAPNSSSKEVLTVTGHTAPVIKALFHPVENTTLCSAASDSTVRLWDVRGASQRSTGKIDVKEGSSPVYVCWNTVQNHILAVTERSGTVFIYDTRKLTSTLNTFPMHPDCPETCLFDPTGNFLVAGTTYRGEGMGVLRTWNWKQQETGDGLQIYSYPAHAGPIYAMQFSPNGKRLATGGSDAVVGLWDVDTMCCCYTITRRVKFIRGVAFSHDNAILCTSTEEDTIDIADGITGATIGAAKLSGRNSGAEEIAFHPSNNYLLACARTDTGIIPTAPVTVVKLSVGSE